MKATTKQRNSSQGPAVDKFGNSVKDPTPNVMELVAAAVTRLDDLREASDERENDLRLAENQRCHEVSQLRDTHIRELRAAEAGRIDAIRAVDVGNVQRAAEQQAQQAATLATQVAVSAETLRTQVQATAIASTVALAAALEPMQKSIDDLRRAQYEAQGQKTQVVESRGETADMKPVIDAIELLGKAQEKSSGVNEGKSISWSNIVTIIMVAAVLITLLIRSGIVT